MATGVWAPFKELVGVVNAAIQLRQPGAYYSLEANLKKHKPDFVSLLQNPAKSSHHRQLVQKAVKEGLQTPGLPPLPSLPQDFVDEALILSDILELNELSAVELLLAGEQQLPRFPGLTRGLVAVLLYHDGRRSLVSALRALIQAREGVSWTLGLSNATTALVTSFTDQLFTDGLVEKILTLLEQIDADKELERLAKGRAVGGVRHKQQLIDLIQEQRTSLADCLFYYACQSPFPKEATLKIIKHLQKKLEDQTSSETSSTTVTSGSASSAQAQSFKPLDSVTLSLFHTLLACFTIGDATSESNVDDSLIDEHYPLIADATFLPSVHVEILKDSVWACPALHAAVKFAWAVLLRECASRAAFASMSEVEDDESLVEVAVSGDGVRGGDAFQFLRQSVVNSPHFHLEEYYVRRMHWLLTSFIVNMPLKLKELRNLGDEVAREILMRVAEGGVVPSTRRRDFEELMKLIGDLYSSDPHNLELSLEFWAPTEGAPQGGIRSRVPQRQISLYKFVHLSSDLLPAPLFSSLMYMLTGLARSPQTAHHCFNFLKANSPSLGGGGASAAISLDHFFHSLRQYYLGLREGAGPRPTITGCVITPQELEGLQSVLTLITTIAKLDEGARVVMYENQTWLPVASLFGLLGCPIPRSLKAMIVTTLAAFSKSPEIAASMWHTLEIAQVLNTVPSSAATPRTGVFGQPSSQEGSIQIELEEMESQAEEYPLTRAFLTLLDNLTDVPVPATLGTGHRLPGFEPYLEFVRDLVFLKFDSRAYRNSEEKWEVANLALEILHKLLSSHEISPDDFTDQSYELPGGGVSRLPRPPGHTLLVHMMNDSQLLRKILLVIDEACHLLSDVTAQPSEPLAQAALLALKMLETTLSREEEFRSMLREYNQREMVTPLDELLLAINPRTGKNDHLINIARFVSLTHCSPELALGAVKVLYWVSRSHKVAKEMVSAIDRDKTAAGEILHGFVEQLEWEDSEPNTGAPEDGTSEDITDSVSSVHRAVQREILQLLSSCVDSPGPNITHFLLGFETSSSGRIAGTSLQDPGVLGSPRTCLHSILSLVKHRSSLSDSIGCHYSNPKLAELCYKVIYQMCANREMSTPILRYLRNNHDFVFQQLLKLPLDINQVTSANQQTTEKAHMSSHEVATLSQQAWLLKSVAIELRMTSLTQQRSTTQRIVNLLLNRQVARVADPSDLTNGIAAEMTFGSDQGIFQERQKMLVLLDQVDFSDKTMSMLELQYFDQSAVEQALSSCEAQEGSGLRYTDVRVLRGLLMNELNALQGAAVAGQRQSVLQEIYEILEVVVERNQVLETVHANMELFEGWRWLVEVVLHCIGGQEGEGRGGEEGSKITVLFGFIQELLLKVEHSETSELTASVHGVVLTLLAHLRHTVSSSGVESDASTLHSGSLHAILRGLVQGVLKAPSGMQRVRAYLYGALLYHLMISGRGEGKGGGRKASSLWQPGSDGDAAVADSLAVLTSFGEPFMDTLCRDASSGHDVARMLALSLLEGIMSIDWKSQWLRFLVVRGYLQSVCASVQWEDEALQKMLHPQPDALRALYIYQSKIAFLSGVACQTAGARELISVNCLGYLTECRFIDMRPDYHGNRATFGPPGTYSTAAGFVPTIADRYRQMFLPLLRFLLSLISCPGPQQKEACTQVTTLIGAHSEVFAAVLKEPQRHVSMATLQELALVTAVIAHSDVGQDWSSQAHTPLAAGMMRIQRLILSLLPHYCSRQNWRAMVQEVVGGEEEGEGVVTSPLLPQEALLLVQKVCTNVMAYCRVAMTVGGTEFSSPYCRILLTPDLSEALLSSQSREPFPSSLSPSLPPSLGMLIRHLRECTEAYSTALESCLQHSKKMESTSNLPIEEIRQLVPGSPGSEKLSPSQQQRVARRRLGQLVDLRKQELEQLAYIIENLLYVLWRHLHFYLVHCKPVDVGSELGVGGVGRMTMRRMQDPGRPSMESTFDLSSLSEGVKLSDVEQLKTDTVKCLTDSLFKKLLDMEEAHYQSKMEMRVGFVQALVRRIRRLLKLKAAAKPIL